MTQIRVSYSNGFGEGYDEYFETEMEAINSLEVKGYEKSDDPSISDFVNTHNNEYPLADIFRETMAE